MPSNGRTSLVYKAHHFQAPSGSALKWSTAKVCVTCSWWQNLTAQSMIRCQSVCHTLLMAESHCRVSIKMIRRRSVCQALLMAEPHFHQSLGLYQTDPLPQRHSLLMAEQQGTTKPITFHHSLGLSQSMNMKIRWTSANHFSHAYTHAHKTKVGYSFHNSVAGWKLHILPQYHIPSSAGGGGTVHTGRPSTAYTWQAS